MYSDRIAQVLFAGDEHPVGALGPYRAYEALGAGVARIVNYTRSG
jgi:hypothetical protein